MSFFIVFLSKYSFSEQQLQEETFKDKGKWPQNWFYVVVRHSGANCETGCSEGATAVVEKRPVMSHWPGLQVFPCNGEGSGKHLYLKSTLSTLVLSEHSLEQCVCVGGAGDGGRGGGAAWGVSRSEQVTLRTHADNEGASRTHSSAASLEPLYGDCFISVPLCPLGGRGPGRMTLIFWKQSVQYWSVRMSSLWHGLIYWTWEGSLFPVIPELIAVTFTAAVGHAVCVHTSRWARFVYVHTHTHTCTQM